MKKIILFVSIAAAFCLSACGSQVCTCTVTYYTASDSVTGSRTSTETIDGSKCSNGNKTVTTNGITAKTVCN